MNWKSVPSFSVLIVVLLSLNQPMVFSDSYTNVNVSQANEMIDSNPSLVILDVRTWDEYISGHIRNATLIPVGELEGRLSELDSQKPTIVYCRSGGRSSTASQILVDHGFIEVYNMFGGIVAWTAAGYLIVQIEVPKDYATIQAAIKAANEGDIIFVSSGRYRENVVVNKKVSLVGEDPQTTVIDGNGTAYYVLRIIDRNVNITKFTIQNGYEGVSLRSEADSCFIADCKIVNNSYGIFVQSDNNLLTKNIIVNNSEAGIMILASCGCSPLQGNIATDNMLLNNGYGINLVSSMGNLVYHNNFVNNTQQVYTVSSYTVWDGGYGSGGNYWSDYSDVDLCSGSYQNETGSDGFWDHPYIVDENNQDNYPFRNPYIFLTPEEMRVLYNELLTEHRNLNSTYYELLDSYNNLQASYNQLQGQYDLLGSSYSSLQTGLNNIRNIMYVFIATTVILTIATVYLVTKTKYSRQNITNQ